MNAAELSRLCIPQSLSVGDALARMDECGQGVLLAVDARQALIRTVTDGDLRRAVISMVPMDTELARLPFCAPITVHVNAPASEVQLCMERHRVDQVVVVNDDRCVVDVVFLRELAHRIWLSSPHMGDDEAAMVSEAFQTNWIAPLGPHVDAFERELADQVGVGHAAALSSGTAAIHLGLVLLGVGTGDMVFCSSLTFVGSCNPILYCGAQPVFIDSEPQSWNMSPVALERALSWAATTGRLPKAVIIVNLYGQSADMGALLPLCERYSVPVLEDAAESLGATYQRQASGSFGRVGIFSFNGNKIITTSGGGMLVSDDAVLVQRARKLSTQAREAADHYEHVEMGFNYRLSNVLAGIGRGQLRVLGQRIAQRRAVFARYRDALADVPGLAWMPEPAGSVSNRWLSCMTVDARAPSQRIRSLLNALARHNIEARPVWKPMHLQPLFRGAPYFAHQPDHDVAADLFARGLCLPSGSNLQLEQQDRVIEVLRGALLGVAE